MFVVGTERRAWWPVTWTAAADGDESGAIVENRIELRFRLLDLDQVDELRERADAADEEPARARSAIYARLLGEIATNWRGVARESDADGEEAVPLPFEPANMRLLMKIPGVWPAVLEAYRDCLGGVEKVREGN